MKFWLYLLCSEDLEQDKHMGELQRDMGADSGASHRHMYSCHKGNSPSIRV